MCGILAYQNKNGLDRTTIEKAMKSLNVVEHRGPDGEGLTLLSSKNNEFFVVMTEGTPSDIKSSINYPDNLHDYDIILGHRRLSIFDISSNGHQPMKIGEYWIVFNGEIYNFYEIKSELSNKGYQFATGTDTEVIVNAYKEWGTDCLKRFNGMWSIIIWDPSKKEFFVSNDRFGVKPLYYFQSENELIFSSEIKQIRQFDLALSLNNDAVLDFLNFSQVGTDLRTFYHEIKRFPKSNYSKASIHKGLGEFHPYFKVKLDQIKRSDQDAIEEFRSLFKSAVEVRLRADVSWGIGVSGGLDSSAIAFQAHQLTSGEKINTFSAVFQGNKEDESEHIKRVVDGIGASAHYVNPLESFSTSQLEELVHFIEMPVQTAAFLAQYRVSQTVKQTGSKILLVGQGADEVFGGYHHHFYTYCRWLITQMKLSTYKKEIRCYAELKDMDINHMKKIVSGEVKSMVKSKFKGSSGMNLAMRKQPKNLNEILFFDFYEYMLPFYLQSDDRTGMASSIESRHPFMDYRLVEFGYSIQDNQKIRDGWQKWLIRESSDFLPDELRWRKDKKGFATPQNKFVEAEKEFFSAYEKIADEAFPNSNGNTFRKAMLGIWLKQNSE